MMNTTTVKPAPNGSRFWRRLNEIAQALDYNQADYMLDQISWFQAELTAVNARVARLEARLSGKAIEVRAIQPE
jgi:hypothetical protein